MSQPQVSVIIPTYNCASYLAEAIDSVLAQTYSNFEIIVVDDGSTDHTAEVLHRYENLTLHSGSIQIIHQQNQGVALARNHGIQNAKGRWVAFLDADDVFLPDKLMVQMELARANPKLGMIHSGWQRVDSQGNLLMIVEPWHQVPELTLESWLRWKPVLPSAMLFRRDWLVRAGGFNPQFPPAEDTELVLRLSLMGCQAVWAHSVTVKYRQHESSAMHKGLPQAKSLSAVINHFFSQPNLPEQIRRLEKQTRYHTLVWLAWYLYYTGHPSEMIRYLEQAWTHSPYSSMETIVHWADSFTGYAQNWGDIFDAEDLASSPEWRTLMQWAACRT